MRSHGHSFTIFLSLTYKMLCLLFLEAVLYHFFRVCTIRIAGVQPSGREQTLFHDKKTGGRSGTVSSSNGNFKSNANMALTLKN